MYGQQGFKMPTNNELAEKIAAITQKLASHLDIAKFVDDKNGEEIKRLFKKYNDLAHQLVALSKEISAVELDVAVLKGANSTKKDYFGFIAKWVIIVCTIVGTIVAVMKYGTSTS